MTGPPVVPAWGQRSLADLLPSVIAAMGAGPANLGSGLPSPGVAVDRPAIELPAADRVCLLLVDGLGLDLLADAAPADAPFLRSLLTSGCELDAGFPSSTPISLCSLGTGRAPGEHGIVGFAMHVPPVPAVMECLGWTRYGTAEPLIGVLPPEELQPHEPWAGLRGDAAAVVTVVSLREHMATGLTRAAFRGARFDPIATFTDADARVARVRTGLARGERALVYTYDGRLDTAAHQSGVGSEAWRGALRAVDAMARRLVAALPAGGMLLVTGDHGGIDVPASARIDLADRADLSADVAWLSGDPRARHVHAREGRERDVLDAWRTGLGNAWTVLSRDEAIAAGLFGPRVLDAVRPRIGDVVAIAGTTGGIFDLRRFPWEQRLVGFHGGLSRGELKVPLLRVVG
jgi:hypothetical protein